MPRNRLLASLGFRAFLPARTVFTGFRIAFVLSVSLTVSRAVFQNLVIRTNIAIEIFIVNVLVFFEIPFRGHGTLVGHGRCSLVVNNFFRDPRCSVRSNLFPFVDLCAGVLSDDPLFVIINSYTTGLSPSTLTYIAETVFTKRFGGHSVSDELGLPVSENGLALPCGAACRWER